MAILQLRQKYGNSLENKLILEHLPKENLMIFVCLYIKSRIDKYI